MNALMSEIPVTNQEIAHVLFKVASILELVEENAYRVRAYRRGAIAVLTLPRPFVDYIATDEPAPLPGIGERLRNRLYELVNTGSMGVYDSLLDEIGEPLASLLTVNGIGPKTAVRLVRELRIDSLPDLIEAGRIGKIQTLHGFGPKREAHLLRQAERALSTAA